MESLDGAVRVALLNLVLSGDNLLVVAAAVQGLPGRVARWALLGALSLSLAVTGLAAAGAGWLLALPVVRAVGGVVLLLLALDLARGPTPAGAPVPLGRSLWAAVLASVTRSVDNALALAVPVAGDRAALVLGLVLSLPVLALLGHGLPAHLARRPGLRHAAAAVVGWMAARLLLSDPWLGAPLAPALGAAVALAARDTGRAGEAS